MKILVGIDGGAQQSTALALGAQLARGGQLIVATIYPVARTSAGLGRAYARKAEEAASEVLAAAGEKLAQTTFDARAIGDVSAARALHRLALEEQVDAIVIGSCHRGTVARAVLGGTGERVVHGSPVPVVVAPRDYAGDASELRRIGIAYDGSPEADVALAWAERLAVDTGAALDVLGVTEFMPVAMYPGVAAYPTDDLMRELHGEAARTVDVAVDRVAGSVTAEGRVFDGPVVRSLVEASEGLGLIVVGSRGYGPVGSLLMGSVSSGVMHEAKCPVVVVPRSAAGAKSTTGAGALSATR